MSFRFLDHTADVQVECSAGTFEELLRTASDALYTIALKGRLDGKSLDGRVFIHGESREELLVRWLQELLFLLDTEAFVATDIDFSTVTDKEVVAAVHGYACNREDRAEEIKSATYHDLHVEERPEGLVAKIIFDL